MADTEDNPRPLPCPFCGVEGRMGPDAGYYFKHTEECWLGSQKGFMLDCVLIQEVPAWNNQINAKDAAEYRDAVKTFSDYTKAVIAVESKTPPVSFSVPKETSRYSSVTGNQVNVCRAHPASYGSIHSEPKDFTLFVSIDTDDDALVEFEGRRYCYYLDDLQFTRQFYTAQECYAFLRTAIVIPPGYKCSEALREWITDFIKAHQNGEGWSGIHGNQTVEISITNLKEEDNAWEQDI